MWLNWNFGQFFVLFFKNWLHLKFTCWQFGETTPFSVRNKGGINRRREILNFEEFWFGREFCENLDLEAIWSTEGDFGKLEILRSYIAWRPQWNQQYNIIWRQFEIYTSDFKEDPSRHIPTRVSTSSARGSLRNFWHAAIHFILWLFLLEKGDICTTRAYSQQKTLTPELKTLQRVHLSHLKSSRQQPT